MEQQDIRPGSAAGSNEALECLDIVMAIEVLEYHDKNYLAHKLACNPGECSRKKQRLLQRAINYLNATK